MLHTGFVLGAYHIETLLGRGAMGIVYRGVRLTDGALAAIKVVHTDLLAGKEHKAILARFRQEAEIGMRLRHPLIVRVYDYGEQDDLLYLTMELIEGQELGRLLARQATLPLAMNLAIVLQVLNALTYAHQHGVIHRDIKPANIMVRPDYTIVLTDFGVAHLGGSELTQVGELLGSPLYMAPEQLIGEPVDGRSDLFSTGVLLYFLLTQRKPFIADSLAALMHKILHEEPVPPSVINRALPTVFDPLLRRALAKNPTHRFANAAEFAVAVRQARVDAFQATTGVPSLDDWQTVPPLGVSGSGLDQATMIVSAGETLIQPLMTLVEDCLTDRATRARLDRLAEQLTMLLAIADHLGDHDGDRQRIRQWLARWPLAALIERIKGDAPLPGRILREARGDWLELVRLFTLLRDAGHRLGESSDLDRAHEQIIEELTGAVLNYSGVLNPQLFRIDGPQLAGISADLMRLEVLQFALEELGAAVEAQNVRQTLLLFANQIMGRVNALIRQFVNSHDPLARFDIANLLVEVEDLIMLAERLIQSHSAGGSMGQMGSVVMVEFIDNARQLAKFLTHELVQHIQYEHQRTVETEQPAFNIGQTVFVGRLRQLGLLYRFAAYWQNSDSPMEALRQLAADMHSQLESLADALLAALNIEGITPSSATADLLWARLTIIADLAEQFGWPELHRRVLLAARNWVQMR
ncbi:MAG: eukaryotic-like serine/threonine-protein kinase [Pseudomonadota bacterium]|nr:eukaryotic-like serine/threonine-protein kinase [Pseudomonadota bacterium]